MCTGPGSGQGQSPRIFNRLRDFRSSYEAVPVTPYLGVMVALLKGVGERFEAFGDALAADDQRRIERFGQFDLAPVDDLVGEQQGGEQQLARFGQGAEPGNRLAALAIDQNSGGAKIFFLAIAASDAIGAPGDGQLDFGHLASSLADDRIELGQHRRDLAAQGVVGTAMHCAALDRPLDAKKGAFGAFHGLIERCGIHHFTA